MNQWLSNLPHTCATIMEKKWYTLSDLGDRKR